MANPWLGLSSLPPYVLPEDRLRIEAFNAKCLLSSPWRLDVETVIPEPFVGAVNTAPVVVLQLNPGLALKDPEAHADPQFRDALFANLRHEHKQWPFYFFDLRFRDSHPGGLWWKDKTKKLAEAIPLEHLGRRLAVSSGFRTRARSTSLVAKSPAKSTDSPLSHRRSTEEP